MFCLTFWTDCSIHEVTVAQCIEKICRYLLWQDCTPEEGVHNNNNEEITLVAIILGMQGVCMPSALTLNYLQIFDIAFVYFLANLLNN